MSMSLSSAPVVPARATSVAHRLLAGAGTASFVAYRRDAECSIAVPAHGLTPTGELIVAHRAGDVLNGATGVADVRVDIRREATEAQVRILAATVHLLGRIAWASPTSQRGLLASDWMPQTVRAVAAAPDVVLGVVRAERLLLHDGSGVSPLPFAEVVRVDRAGNYPSARDEFDAHEAVAALEPDVLYDIYAAALERRLPSDVLSERPVKPTCGAAIGRIFCVDVDSLGLTLMHIGATSTTVAFVPFPEPVRDHEQLCARLRGLLPRTRS